MGRSRDVGSRSLWLSRSRTPVTVHLERWRGYPHFFDTLEQYEGTTVPATAVVRWAPFADFTPPGLLSDEQDWQFVDELVERMRAGEDIPPLVRDLGKVFDGVHRAHAAKQLRLRVAPTINLHLLGARP